MDTILKSKNINFGNILKINLYVLFFLKINYFYIKLLYLKVFFFLKKKRRKNSQSQNFETFFFLTIMY